MNIGLYKAVRPVRVAKLRAEAMRHSNCPYAFPATKLSTRRRIFFLDGQLGENRSIACVVEHWAKKVKFAQANNGSCAIGAPLVASVRSLTP